MKAMQHLQPYYHSKFGVGLYTWRDLSLSQMTGNVGFGKVGVIGWNLCHSGSNKKLKTGEESIRFSCIAQAHIYLKKNYRLKVAGVVEINDPYWLLEECGFV